MTFPMAELKFSRIINTPTVTRVLVRLYRVDDGGVDANGQQLYARTLKRERELTLDAGWDAPRILVVGRARLVEWAQEQGWNFSADRLICTL